MPKPLSTKRRPTDINQLAYQLVQESTQEEAPPPTQSEISRIMAAMGRKGGLIGGKRRLETMTHAKRVKIARAAAKARWSQKA